MGNAQMDRDKQSFSRMAGSAAASNCAEEVLAAADSSSVARLSLQEQQESKRCQFHAGDMSAHASDAKWTGAADSNSAEEVLAELPVVDNGRCEEQQDISQCQLKADVLPACASDFRMAGAVADSICVEETLAEPAVVGDGPLQEEHASKRCHLQVEAASVHASDFMSIEAVAAASSAKEVLSEPAAVEHMPLQEQHESEQCHLQVEASPSHAFDVRLAGAAAAASSAETMLPERARMEDKALEEGPESNECRLQVEVAPANDCILGLAGATLASSSAEEVLVSVELPEPLDEQHESQQCQVQVETMPVHASDVMWDGAADSKSAEEVLAALLRVDVGSCEEQKESEICQLQADVLPASDLKLAGIASTSNNADQEPAMVGDGLLEEQHECDRCKLQVEAASVHASDFRLAVAAAASNSTYEVLSDLNVIEEEPLEKRLESKRCELQAEVAPIHGSDFGLAEATAASSSAEEMLLSYDQFEELPERAQCELQAELAPDHVSNFGAAEASVEEVLVSHEQFEEQQESKQIQLQLEVQQRLCSGDFRWIVLEDSLSPSGTSCIVDAYAVSTPGGRPAAAARTYRRLAEAQQLQWLHSEACLRKMCKDALRRIFNQCRTRLLVGESPSLARGPLPKQLHALLTIGDALFQHGDLVGAQLALHEAEAVLTSFYGFTSVLACASVRQILGHLCGFRVGVLCVDADQLSRGRPSSWNSSANQLGADGALSLFGTSAGLVEQRMRVEKEDRREEWRRRIMAAKSVVEAEPDTEEDPELKERLREIVQRPKRQFQGKQHQAEARRVQTGQDSSTFELERRETEEDRHRKMWRQAQAWMKEAEAEAENVEEVAVTREPAAVSQQKEVLTSREIEQEVIQDQEVSRLIDNSSRRRRMDERRRRTRGAAASEEESLTESSQAGKLQNPAAQLNFVAGAHRPPLAPREVVPEEVAEALAPEPSSSMSGSPSRKQRMEARRRQQQIQAPGDFEVAN